MRQRKLSTFLIGLACAVALAIAPLRAALSAGVDSSGTDFLVGIDQGLDANAPLLGLDLPTVIPGRYIVVLKTGVLTTILQAVIDVAKINGGQIHFEYTSALVGFAATLPPLAVEILRHNPNVAFIEADQIVTLSNVQLNPLNWGLDRIDQRDLPLDNRYDTHVTLGSSNILVYILDTGIRATHEEFLRLRTDLATDTVGDGQNGNDCNGHGTHVAGIVAGRTYGVAKGVSLVNVRVLNCEGSGAESGVIAGIDWVTNLHFGGVANLSFWGPPSTALDEAVRNSIATGITYVIAAGNENQDACNVSPARVTEAITVGATSITDDRASFSNYGTCVDLFAPGVGITSASNTSDEARATLSGTSMAAPHVAGVAALYLSSIPFPSETPQQVQDAMVREATAGVINNPGSGSPNLLLYSFPNDTGLDEDVDGDGVTVRQGDCDDRNPAIHPGATELCNSINDNCEDGIDEGFDLGQSCSVGLGACQQSGVTVCTPDGSSSQCNATPGTPGTEMCNGIDEDCDGFVDDSPTDAGQSCTTGQPGICSTGTIICTGGALACHQTTPSSTEVCDGLDNDCDGLMDNADPNCTPTDLSVTKQAPVSLVVKVGGQVPLPYTVKVKNTGPGVASGVMLSDPLPSGTTFVSISTSQGSCSTPAVGLGGTVSCNVGTLPHGVTATVTLVVKVRGGLLGIRTITNTATVGAGTSDPNSANNAATAKTTAVTVLTQ